MAGRQRVVCLLSVCGCRRKGHPGGRACCASIGCQTADALLDARLKGLIGGGGAASESERKRAMKDLFNLPGEPIISLISILWLPLGELASHAKRARAEATMAALVF